MFIHIWENVTYISCTGFRYVTTEKIVDIGDFEITVDNTNRADWSPLTGVAVMVVDGMMLITAQYPQVIG